MNSAIDQLVTDASRDFVSRLSSLNEDPYIREAVMKLAIREVAWATLEAFGDKFALSEQLRTLGDLVEESEDKDSEDEDSD